MAEIELVEGMPGTPENTQYNFAKINAFRLIAIELPGVDFYCQTVQFPPAVMENAGSWDNPLNSIPVTGTKLEYGELMVTFIVDEKFANYRSVYDWICGITFPQDHKQFQALVDKKKAYMGGMHVASPEASIRSDLHLVVLDSMDNPIVRYEFKSAFPSRLESLPFDVTISDVNYFTVAVSFRFDYYLIEPV